MKLLRPGFSSFSKYFFLKRAITLRAKTTFPLLRGIFLTACTYAQSKYKVNPGETQTCPRLVRVYSAFTTYFIHVYLQQIRMNSALSSEEPRDKFQPVYTDNFPGEKFYSNYT